MDFSDILLIVIWVCMTVLIGNGIKLFVLIIPYVKWSRELSKKKKDEGGIDVPKITRNP